MSWVPPSSSGSYEPQSRTAPRPAAAAPIFTFGRLGEQGAPRVQAQGADTQPAAISQRPEKANYDPPVDTLRWWQQPRNAATVSGSSNSDVEAFWGKVKGDSGAVAALCNTQARLSNKAQGVGSTVAASLGDREQYTLSGARSAYKDDMCAAHVPTGKRGVVLPPAAMAAYEESRKQAQRNKTVGRATNMQLALF